MLVRNSSDLETNVVSVERVKEYAEVDTEVISSVVIYFTSKTLDIIVYDHLDHSPV